MNVRSFMSDQLRALLQLLDLAVAIQPELEAALRERGEPATRPVTRKERIGKLLMIRTIGAVVAVSQDATTVVHSVSPVGRDCPISSHGSNAVARDEPERGPVDHLTRRRGSFRSGVS
jgi:hypothetical protein